MDSCGECGFDYFTLPRFAVSPSIALGGTQHAARLAAPAAALTGHPAPDVWSPLEYACHVRDVCRVFEGRVQQLLAEDVARFANWDQDEAAGSGRYGEEDPAVVAAELAESAVALSRAFAAVGGDDWGRRGVRSNGSEFTVLTLGQYMLHDLAHHLVDVGAVPTAAGR